MTDSGSAIQIGIVTMSDRASRGEYEDLSGPAIVEYLEQALISQWVPVKRLIEDERSVIEQTLIELCDTTYCPLIVTTGGTGPAPRDVTRKRPKRFAKK